MSRSTTEGSGGSRLRWAALLGVVAVLAAGCSGVPNSALERAMAKAPASNAHAAAGAKAVAGPAPRLTITPADHRRHVSPQRDVQVAITRGKLEQVTLITTGSDPVSGALNGAGTAWHSTAPLHPSRRYTVTATAAEPSGKQITRTSWFRTLTPAATFSAQTLLGHQTYGVGIPIMITFSRPIRNKAAVERSIKLWSSKPVVGAWYWDGNQALDFRPRTYWPQHTRVRFVAHLAGVEAAPGVYGTANLSQSFRIGNSLIAVVSTRTHYENIYYKKKLLGHWPVSTGSPGDDTANGTYLSIEKGNPVLMSGPGYTNFPVPWSVRFTWSGNYMHDAYWSVGEQGVTNVSHGCVNMSPAHAETYYKLSVPGDPVTVTGSPVAGTWDDGWTEWFLSWKHLLHGSATHLAVKAGPSGSTFVNPATLSPAPRTRVLVTSKPGNYRAG